MLLNITTDVLQLWCLVAFSNKEKKGDITDIS